MPFVSQAQRKWMFAKKPRMAAEWASKTPKGAKLPEHVKKSKKKAKFVVNNKMKDFGRMDTKTNIVEVNKKKHKGDRRELADTIQHELLHVKHPQMKEKTVQKKTTPELSRAEQDKLIARLRMKKLNYKSGTLKRKFKMKRDEKVEPGTFINKMNESQSPYARGLKEKVEKEQIAIRGMV